jgi:predicted AAA+ superfamily ATPase
VIDASGVRRTLENLLAEAMSDTPVVLLQGPRQCGKSTLAQSIAKRLDAKVLTFDDPGMLRFASEDPSGFLDTVAWVDGKAYQKVVLDEIQHVPELFLAIKAAVDRNRLPGRFLLTGSANVLTLPRLSESLAGRMEILDLYPFSQGELEGHRDGFVETLFQDDFKPEKWEPDSDLIPRMVRGGFPEPALKRSGARLRSWFTSYARTLNERDVRDLANIERAPQLHRMLSLIAHRVASPLNKSGLASDTGVPFSTLERYFELLRSVFFVHLVPPWWTSASARLVRSPKAYVLDTGLLCALLQLDEGGLSANRDALGPVLENFVAGELLKQCRWSQAKRDLCYLRTARQYEVDFVIEEPSGSVVGVEVKAAATIQSSDLRGMRFLRDLAGDRFRRGIILCLAKEPSIVDRDVWALPVSALWRLGANKHARLD